MIKDMNIIDLKIWSFSSLAITMNLMGIDTILSLILTATALAYTLHKWYLMWQKNKNEKKSHK